MVVRRNCGLVNRKQTLSNFKESVILNVDAGTKWSPLADNVVKSILQKHVQKLGILVQISLKFVTLHPVYGVPIIRQ